jgi:beta-1,4-mannosyltransferase
LKRPPFRIIAFPKSGHPYNELFYRAVESERIPVLEGDWSGRWIWSNVRPGDVAHLHWPSHAYESRGGRLRLLRSFVRWAALVALFRLKRVRIVWTAHNLLPHKRSDPPIIDILGRHLLISLADLILVHGANAASELVARFPAARDKLVLIPLGNWIGYYPVAHARDAARAELGISPSSFAFLFFGLCAPYKNLDGLVRAFRELPGDVVLLIAGRFQERSYQDEILGLAGADVRVRIYPVFIPDADVHIYLLAADAVVVPYRETLTSGTAMLALSFGRPILSISRGFLKDIVTPEVGLLFSPEHQGALPRALAEMSARHFDEQAILEHARRYTYEDAARRLVGALSRLDI